MIRISVAMALLAAVFDTARVAATDEPPLGSKKSEIVAAYGRPDPPSIGLTAHPPGSLPIKNFMDVISYRSLKPPRFYWLIDDHAISVYYYDLTDNNLDFVKTLLSAHAKGDKIEDIAPKTEGWDDRAAHAWRCKSKNWIALYRTTDNARPSLLIRTEQKDRTPKDGAASGSHHDPQISYDEKGRMTECREFNTDGSIKSTTAYHYLPNGSLDQTTIEPHPDRSRTETYVHYPSQDLRAFKAVKIYDAQGKLLSEKIYNSKTAPPTSLPGCFLLDKKTSAESK